MTETEVITKIKKAKHALQLVSEENLKDDYHKLLLVIHPDRCKTQEATDAAAKLNSLIDIYKNGQKGSDELGDYLTNGYWIKRKLNLISKTEDSKLFIKGIENCRTIRTRINSPHLNKYYLNESFITEGEYVKQDFSKRAIWLGDIDVLPTEHVRWILSRLLEFSGMLSDGPVKAYRYIHGALVPENVFIMPDEHGIQVINFHHMTKVGTKMSTIDGKYQSWYPADLFKDKVANPLIDMQMAKKIAIKLMGDKSGVGTSLRTKHEPEFVNFLLKNHESGEECFTEYRDLLTKLYPKKFHILDM